MDMPCGPYTTMYRIEIDNQVYYSKLYERVKKRNSYTTSYLDSGGTNHFGAIEHFIHFNEKVIAILKPLRQFPGPAVTSSEDLGIEIECSFITPVSIADDYDACYADDIVAKCLYVDVGCSQYVVEFPSTVLFD